MMFGFSTAKLIGMGIGLLAVLGFIALALHWKSAMTERGQKLAIICTATGEAADNPKLGCGNVVIQIQQLGASLKNTTDALNRQNAAVADLGAKTTAQQKAAAEALGRATGRANGAEATAQRLSASSHQATRGTAPCAPSDALKGAWQ